QCHCARTSLADRRSLPRNGLRQEANRSLRHKAGSRVLCRPQSARVLLRIFLQELAPQTPPAISKHRPGSFEGASRLSAGRPRTNNLVFRHVGRDAQTHVWGLCPCSRICLFVKLSAPRRRFSLAAVLPDRTAGWAAPPLFSLRRGAARRPSRWAGSPPLTALI